MADSTTERALTPLKAGQPLDAKLIESALIKGDLAPLTTEQRVSYYNAVCESIGLNPLTKPFEYITLNGKLRLYALKDATEQLRKIHGVSITEVTSQRLEDVFVVTAKAQDKSGRTDAATGAVAIGNLKGENLANALMKAETKAKRRATLSICGLGMLDETEVESIPPLVVEAPKDVVRGPLPQGCVYITGAQVQQWGGEVTTLDANGEVITYKTTDSKTAERAEQTAQENPAVPVTVELQKITRGKNIGKEKLVGFARYKAPEPKKDENATLDAEILAKESELPL